MAFDLKDYVEKIMITERGENGLLTYEQWAAREREEFCKPRYLGVAPEPYEIEAFERRLPDSWKRHLEERVEWAEDRARKFLEKMPTRAGQAALATNTDDPNIALMSGWWQEHKDDGLLAIAGPVGVGKTVMACWWSWQLKWPAVFVRSTEIAAASRYDADQRAKWMDASHLIVDDLGSEYLDPKGSLLVDLDELVDVFYADKRHLIITTNCTKSVFKERYGARIADRFREAGTWLAITGESRRKARP